MEPLFAFPLNMYQGPEWTSLAEQADKTNFKKALLVWTALLIEAARLNENGLVYAHTMRPLTVRTIARWSKLSHPEQLPKVLKLLCDCDLLEPTANQQYRIKHWERFAVIDSKNHHGLIKFYQPNQSGHPDLQPAPLAPPLTGVTPLALQKYTPAQRAKLATTTGKILTYLQQQSGKQFSNEPATQILLAGLFDQKVTIKQIKQVIDWKCKDWYETDFWKFVRPQTLFGPKFKQYLLEAPPPAHVQPAAQLTRTQYLRDLYQLSCGDVAMVLRRAADEEVTVTEEEVEAIGRDLGY